MIGRTNVSGGEPPLPPQTINYTMLYYLGDECTDVTGGWKGYAYRQSGGGWSPVAPTVQKNSDNLYARMNSSSYGSHSSVFAENQIDLSEYVGMYVKGNGQLKGDYAQAAVDITSNKQNNYTILKDILTITKHPASDYPYSCNIYSTFGGIGNAYVSIRFQAGAYGYGYIYLYCMALVKRDDITGLSDYGSNIATIISNATSLLASKKAIRYMVSQCTGDFMVSAIANSDFITALNTSPNKNMVLANEHWAKFLALVA